MLFQNNGASRLWRLLWRVGFASFLSFPRKWESRKIITKMMKDWIPVGIYPAIGGTGMTFCGFSEATTFGGGRLHSTYVISC